VEVEPPTKEEVFLKKLKDQHRIPDERFEQGVEFASLIADGNMTASKAYAEAFDVDITIANKKSSKMKHSKWIQELIRFHMFDDDLEYTAETKVVIQRLMSIVNDPRASHREVTEATKALQPYIKQQIQKVQAEIKVEHKVDATDAVMTKMTKVISELADNGKMLDQNGEIIDVTVVM